MKNYFATITLCLMAAMSSQAQETMKFDGIDYVNIARDVNFDTCHVYIVPTVLAEKKGSKKAEQQDIAFAELGPTIARELKASFRHGTFEVIADTKAAPAGAIVVEACLKQIDWGSAGTRQLTMGTGGGMAGTYGVKVSDGNGLILEYDTRRHHTLAFRSALGPDVIRVYNRAVATDLVTILIRNEKSSEQQISGIDYVAVSQSVNLDNSKVCIVPIVLADYKPKKDQEEQTEAFNELGKTVQDMLKKEFKTATFELIADAKDAPADAIVIEAILKDIDWSTATAADRLGGAKEDVSGSYQVRISNAQGKMLEFKNRRHHNTAMSSSKAHKLIRVYNNALAKDLIAVLKKVK